VNTEPPIPPGVSRTTDPLYTRRCARHREREAAARCPACGESFCRECVVEHEGRLLCTGCLAKELKQHPARRLRWAVWRRTFSLGAAGLVAWLAFYWGGRVLLKIPPAFHDGTIWKSSRVDAP